MYKRRGNLYERRGKMYERGKKVEGLNSLKDVFGSQFSVLRTHCANHLALSANQKSLFVDRYSSFCSLFKAFGSRI
jgi:hypothetical protein